MEFESGQERGTAMIGALGPGLRNGKQLPMENQNEESLGE
jgi:hypothetical protein